MTERADGRHLETGTIVTPSSLPGSWRLSWQNTSKPANIRPRACSGACACSSELKVTASLEVPSAVHGECDQRQGQGGERREGDVDQAPQHVGAAHEHGSPGIGEELPNAQRAQQPVLEQQPDTGDRVREEPATLWCLPVP